MTKTNTFGATLHWPDPETGRPRAYGPDEEIPDDLHQQMVKRTSQKKKNAALRAKGLPAEHSRSKPPRKPGETSTPPANATDDSSAPDDPDQTDSTDDENDDSGLVEQVPASMEALGLDLPEMNVKQVAAAIDAQPQHALAILQAETASRDGQPRRGVVRAASQYLPDGD